MNCDMSEYFPSIWEVYCHVLEEVLAFFFVFVGEDYSIASSDVVLLEGETSKAVPIYIINDIYPELEESLLVQLLNETTGGAKLGALTEAIIIIEASDDPYGLFGNETSPCLLLVYIDSHISLFLEPQN